MENKQQFVTPNQSFFSLFMELIGKQAIETQLKNTVIAELKITVYGDGTVKLQEDCNTSIIDERKVQSFRQPKNSIITRLDSMTVQNKIKYIVSKQNTIQDKAIAFIANKIGRSIGLVYNHFYGRCKTMKADSMAKLNNLVIEYLTKEQSLPE